MSTSPEHFWTNKELMNMTTEEFREAVHKAEEELREARMQAAQAETSDIEFPQFDTVKMLRES